MGTRRIPYATGIVIQFFITIIFIILSVTIGESDEVYSILEHIMLVIGAGLNLFPLWVLMSLSGRTRIIVDLPDLDSEVSDVETSVLSRVLLDKSPNKEIQK